jgi:tetratricopeptide (TPR) repeat protein
MPRFDARQTPPHRCTNPDVLHRENGRRKDGFKKNTEEDTVKRPARFFSLLCLFALTLSVAAAQEIAERSTPELLRYGKALYERGECFSSRYLFQQVLERDPENREALAGKGQALVCEGSFDEGISALEQVAQRTPRHPEAFVQLASAYLEQYEHDPERYEARLQDALTALSRAESAGAGSAAVDNLRGVIHYRRGDLSAARDALVQATTKQADVADYHRNLGRVYLDLGNAEAATKVLRRAVLLEPDSALGHNQLGSAYFVLGRCEDAVFELEQAVALAPDEAALNFSLGRALFDCGSLSEAGRYLEKVVALEPTAFAPAYTYLARIDLEARDFGSAITQATKGALLPPANAEAYYWLGRAYQARGGTASDGLPDSTKARDAFRRALELDASYRPAQAALEEVANP